MLVPKCQAPIGDSSNFESYEAKQHRLINENNKLMASRSLLGGADMILDILECSNTPKKLSTVTICPSILPNQCIVTVKQSHNQCKTSSGQAETHKFKYPASVQVYQR